MITFHAVGNDVDILGNSQDSQNITLKSNERGEIIFRFWVNFDDIERFGEAGQLDNLILAQPVNIGEFIPDN
ncbi:MAG: hypothetical protein JSV74_03780 [Dehalococcoidia bacterium]|nr:MAG: hypothetical protein JSV74_03780 [Dehalococcoidia bacterium]